MSTATATATATAKATPLCKLKQFSVSQTVQQRHRGRSFAHALARKRPLTWLGKRDEHLMVTTGLEDCSDTATRRTSTCEWLEALLGCTTLVTEGKGPGLLILGINTRARKGLSDLTAEMEENQLWVGGAMAMLILMLC